MNKIIEKDLVIKNYKSKKLNINCVCGRLSFKEIKIAMLLPCEHMFHVKCLEKHKLDFCPICNTEINSKKYITDPINTPHDAQQYSDLLSVTHKSISPDYSVSNIIDNVYDLTKTLVKIPFCKNMKDSRDLVRKYLSLNKIDVHVRGLDRINNKEKKVFIGNHTSYLDFMMVILFIDTYFLSSDFINQSVIGRNIAKILPIMIIKRGQSSSTVDKMKEFIEKNGSIFLYPESVLTQCSSIIRFRTGAFRLDLPIYPVVLRYKGTNTDSGIGDFLFKSTTRKRIDIYMDVLGPYYPPFSDERIETIRKDMADVGHMLTSRVCSKNVVDE